jgi:hypothetical protein
MPVLLEDDLGRPKPQYENQAGTDFEPWKGANGHGNVRSSDGQLVTIGARADSAAADHTVSASVVAILKAILRDVGESPEELQELLDRMGEAVAEPDPHTQLARLQAIIDELDGLNTNVGAVEDLPELDPEASATLAQVLKGLLKTQRDLLDVSGAAKAIELDHARIHEEKAFETDYLFELSADTPQDLHIIVGAKDVHLKKIGVAVKSDDNVFVQLYRNPTATPDVSPDEVPIANCKDTSVETSVVQILTNSDITDVGELIPGRRFFVPGAETLGPVMSVGGASTSWEKILAANNEYVLRVVAPDASTGTSVVHVTLYWYEV